MTDLEQVAKRWDDSEWAGNIPKDYWSHHPIIDAYINANIIPHAADMLEWLCRNFLKDSPRERAISICCGTGTGDRQALAAGVCHYLEGFDISPGSVKIAQKEAEKAGFGDRVRYWVDNANAIILEENRYDVAISLGALHHVEALEHICDQLRRALKPDGYIFMNEYIGPARFQWTQYQLNILNRVMAILPSAWRRTQWIEPIPEKVLVSSDPSEAVRSDKIISILCDNFELVDYCDYGGALLMPLWAQGTIPEVFMGDKRIDKQVIIKLLILIDELLAERGIVPSNYAQLVLRNRPPVPGHSIIPNRMSVHSSDRSRWVEQWLPETNSLDTYTSCAPLFPMWRQLPSKAWHTLRNQGIQAFVWKTGNYLRRLLSKR